MTKKRCVGGHRARVSLQNRKLFVRQRDVNRGGAMAAAPGAWPLDRADDLSPSPQPILSRALGA